ncbi:MAG: extracellular solute-binding protein [Bacillota bacterium]|nr:extracellular solute-binding protein [Bacillota bacterium]
MKWKKCISLLMACLLAATLLAGCGGDTAEQPAASEKKETVTVALWGNQLLESYAQYLCESFPEVEFEFILANNSTDYYRYRNDHGDLPDILTVRRFALKDAVLLKDMLYDLCDTELASTFYGSYLENYTYDDGTVNWLPACAEVDSLIINKTLFEEYNIPVPTDYASFISACEAFEAEGIQGFVSDFDSDYTCMETLQGFSIAQLLTMEGREWRQQYESGATNQLSEKVWMPVFEKFFDMKDKVGLDETDAAMENRAPKDLFLEGKAAMYRGTGADVITFRGRGEDVPLLMPYFGDTEEDNWYLTYPAFQVAASKKAMEDPEREQLILDIMAAMLNQEGLEHIAYGKNMIPYNKNVNLELLPELDNLKPFIDENKMYIRLASNDMFRISREVVQQILKQEVATPQEAFDAFNALLAAENPADQVVAHIDTYYSKDFTEEHGDQAASAICNTIRAEAGVDLLFAQACYISSDIYEGDYTENDLSYLTKNDGGWPVVADLTGEQVYRMVEATLALKDNRGAVCTDSTLYVSSGFEMDISRTEDGGYTLNALTVNGEELDREAVYSVLIFGDRDWYMPVIMEEIGCEDFNDDVLKVKEYVYKRLVEEGGQLEAPTDYITLH